MLDVRNLAYGFASRRVGSDVTFSLSRGETLAVLGGNGAGKTTLFRTLLGLLAPQSGEIRIDGDSLASLAPDTRARRLAYVPQHHEPAFGFTVEEAVLMGRAARLSTFSRPGEQDRQVTNDALARLGIAGLASRPVTELSGGERQLVLIARALAQEAHVLVFDEPTASLDFGNHGKVMREIRALAASGHGVLFTTHDPNHAMRAADRACLLRQGAVIGEGAARHVLTLDNLSALYGAKIQRLTDAGGDQAFLPE
jgi:iron complex transport system ATP-binding protein